MKGFHNDMELEGTVCITTVTRGIKQKHKHSYLWQNCKCLFQKTIISRIQRELKKFKNKNISDKLHKLNVEVLNEDAHHH